MVGYIGGIETMIITFGNVGFSMGRDRVIWRAFSKVSPRTEMPWFAITVLTVPCFLIFIVEVWTGGSLANILADLSSSLGPMFCLYYALTGVASAWMLRKVARTSAWTALTGIVLPLFGAGFLLWIGGKSWGGSANEVRVTFIVAVIVAAVAVVASRYLGKSTFYQERVRTAVEASDLASSSAE
jgi:amino acid transporter